MGRGGCHVLFGCHVVLPQEEVLLLRFKGRFCGGRRVSLNRALALRSHNLGKGTANKGHHIKASARRPEKRDKGCNWENTAFVNFNLLAKDVSVGV